MQSKLKYLTEMIISEEFCAWLQIVGGSMEMPEKFTDNCYLCTTLRAPGCDLDESALTGEVD